MISLLTPLILNTSKPFFIAPQQSSKLIAENMAVDDYQFEAIVPEEIILPKPGERKEYQLGIKITNNTAKSKYFLVGPIVPSIIDFNGNPFPTVSFTTSERAYTNKDYQEIPSKQSLTYYAKLVALNRDQQISFLVCENNGNTWQWNYTPSATYKVSLYYADGLNGYSPLVLRDEKFKNRDNLWAGEIRTSPRIIRIVNPK